MTSGVSGPTTVAYASRDVVSGRSDVDVLRAFAIAAAICWSALFVVIGLRYELQMYADGSIFSYAIAVGDAWAFHWHNISDRLFVYLFCHLPAETYVEMTGDPYGGIVVYGFLFFVAPLLGLTATFAADRSRGRIIFSYACLSTACLCWSSASRPKFGWRTPYSGRPSPSATTPVAEKGPLPWYSRRCSCSSSPMKAR